MKISSEPPIAALFFVGENETSRLRFSSLKIKDFDRDQIFLTVGPSGKMSVRDFFETFGDPGAFGPRRLFSDFFGISGPEGPRDSCS